MSINACSINAHTIDAACGLHSILSSTVGTYSLTVPQGDVVAITDIGDFLGGPVTSIALASGFLNGPGGTFAFTVDPGSTGNIYFGGTATNIPGTYVGQIRIYGSINYVTINFTIVVTPIAGTGGGQQQHVHPDTQVPLNIFRRRPDEEPIVDLKTIEMPFIEVSVEFMGQRFAQTLQRNVTDDIAVVTVFGFSAPSDGVSVNISDIRLTRIK